MTPVHVCAECGRGDILEWLYNEPGQCLYATLKAWINNKDKLAEVTWRALIRTLQSAQVGETALAERLKAEKGDNY